MSNMDTACFYRLLPFLTFINFVFADYCEFGLCETEQYCCGDNKCCKKSLDMWFFWAGVILVLFALAVAAGIRYSRKWQHDTYVLVATHPADGI